MRKKSILKCCLAAIRVGSSLAPALAASPLYSLTTIVKLPGPVKWDYLQFGAPTGRVYISQGSEVTVVNGATGAIIGTLKNLPGSHGIVVNPATGLVYADSAGRQLAVAFNSPQSKSFSARWRLTSIRFISAI